MLQLFTAAVAATLSKAEIIVSKLHYNLTANCGHKQAAAVTLSMAAVLLS
jgi:hypothetical protein